MALIKGKQIKSLDASKVVESASKRFVTDAQIADFAGKATVDQVATAKQEAITAAAAASNSALGEAVDELNTDLINAVNTITTDYEAADATLTTNLAATEAKAEANKLAQEANAASIVDINKKVAANEVAIQNRYTIQQVDTKLAEISVGIKYKGTVASFAEIATRFPEPQEGWLVAVEASKKFYVYDADEAEWVEFPLIIESVTTYNKVLKIALYDNQTVISTGIKTNGEGAHQTALSMLEDIDVMVNGIVQQRETDYTVANTAHEIVITWVSSDFSLETTDHFSVSYNQTI